MRGAARPSLQDVIVSGSFKVINKLEDLMSLMLDYLRCSHIKRKHMNVMN